LVKTPKEGFLSLAGLLIATGLVFLLFYLVLNSYFKNSYRKRKTELLKRKGIGSRNYRSILDSTNRKIKDINREILIRNRELKKIK